jgi:hypothetical protein
MLENSIDLDGGCMDESHGALEVTVSSQCYMFSAIILHKNIPDRACGSDSSDDDNLSTSKSAIGSSPQGLDDVDPSVERWGVASACIQDGSRF